MSILVVEDDMIIRAVLMELLTEVGHTVLEAENGREALDLLRQLDELPSLIMLDLMMPVMTGWELCAVLALDPVLGRIPVAVLSAVSQIGERTRELGAVSTLAKPVELDEILALAAQYDSPGAQR
ncbi:MAG TPA: response regulator [Roseiflexaceae bacterium]|nr:response regulator [Roseiflexaceae bacterium]